jgi:hypothetical protein
VEWLVLSRGHRGSSRDNRPTQDSSIRVSECPSAAFADELDEELEVVDVEILSVRVFAVGAWQLLHGRPDLSNAKADQAFEPFVPFNRPS